MKKTVVISLHKIHTEQIKSDLTQYCILNPNENHYCVFTETPPPNPVKIPDFAANPLFIFYNYKHFRRLK